jgi:hypothetical protein
MRHLRHLRQISRINDRRSWNSSLNFLVHPDELNVPGAQIRELIREFPACQCLCVTHAATLSENLEAEIIDLRRIRIVSARVIGSDSAHHSPVRTTELRFDWTDRV